MPAQTHITVQGDSPTPLHPHLHAQAQAQAHSIKHLTGEVLATAHLLQQQIRTLECLAHATEEREATLVQQRAKLQELLRLVTQMETAEGRATASLRETLARVRTGRSFAALQLSGASPASPSPYPGLGESSSIVSPSPLGGTKGGGSGGGGDADPVDNLNPESASPKKGTETEECEGSGGEQRVGQSGEGEGTDGASKQAGSGGDGDGDGDADDASQPLPQFASLRVNTEDGDKCQCAQGDSKEGHRAPQGDVGVGVPLPLPEADAVANPGASASRPMDQDRCGEDGRARADTGHGAGRVVDLDSKKAQGAGGGVGEEETNRRLASDPRPTGALEGAAGPRGTPTPSRQGNEPTEMKAAVGSDGSRRARRRMPERNGKEQTKGVSAGTGSQQEEKGGQGDIDGQTGGQKKRGGQRTPSPKKAQVPGDRVQPSPPKKAGKAKGGVGRRN